MFICSLKSQYIIQDSFKQAIVVFNTTSNNGIFCVSMKRKKTVACLMKIWTIQHEKEKVLCKIFVFISHKTVLFLFFCVLFFVPRSVKTSYKYVWFSFWVVFFCFLMLSKTIYFSLFLVELSITILYIIYIFQLYLLKYDYYINLCKFYGNSWWFMNYFLIFFLWITLNNMIWN